jgi:TPR repeat protein
MYMTGEGVEVDQARSYMWFRLARDDEPGSGLEVFLTEISEEQVAEAQKMVREWKNAHPPRSN